MKILLFFHGGSLNRGCEAIVRSAGALLKARYPSCQIALASRDPNSDKIIPHIDNIMPDYRRVIKRFSWEWLMAMIRFRLFQDDKYMYKCVHRPLIEVIPDYDVFLSIGGDNYCYGEQPGMYVVDEEIKKHNKRLILWGASIGEEDLTEAKLKDLATFDAVLAREPLTHQILESAGLRNVFRVADGAFLMEREELTLPNGWVDGRMVGLNFSPLVAKRNRGAHAALDNLLNHILKTTEFSVVLTPHVTEPGNDDFEILNHFYQKYAETKRVLILPSTLNATQYKGYIGRMRFFIGARTHATIAAYSSGVPTMVLGYSVKSKGIAVDLFGEELLVISLSEISDKGLLQRSFDGMVKHEGEIQRKLRARLEDVSRMALSAANYVV